MENLRSSLSRVDGGSYKAYKSIAGSYRFPDFKLNIDHVQGDPFAAPSRISIVVPMSVMNIPPSLWLENDPYSVRQMAVEDFLIRSFSQAIRRFVRGRRGSGGSGEIAIARCGQQILQRNAVCLSHQQVEVRFTLGLPAQGRRADGKQATIMFFEELPKLVNAIRYANLEQQALTKHVHSCEDQAVLRSFIEQQGDMAFIANASVLPRESGVSDRPLKNQAIAFTAPVSLTKTCDLPHSGEIQGLCIPPGITLIVGGGYHGKSTLLNALEMGIYQHIPGDGRERVVTPVDTVKVRAEDGRVINRVNIQPFIDNLPFKKDTRHFSTENASGSTSQAANIIEALHCDTRLLLIDEDTSATNFMIRDERMQQLVADNKEPITPLLYRVRDLYEKEGVSSIIVMGGSGDYFDIADTVIMMDAYQPKNVTNQARALAREVSQPKKVLTPFSRVSSRKPQQAVLNASRGKRDVKIDAQGLNHIRYGEFEIDLSNIEQLTDIAQTRSIGLAIHYYATHYASQKNTSLQDGLRLVMRDIDSKGIDILSPYKVGNLAKPRMFEIAAAINRIRCNRWWVTEEPSA